MIDIALVHFRAVDLRYLDAAWYSLSKQDFRHVRQVLVYDNDTDDEPGAVAEVLARYPIPRPYSVIHDKHRDPQKRSQSYSVNAAVRATSAPWVLFTRSDYLLDFSLVAKFAGVVRAQQVEHNRVLSEEDALSSFFPDPIAFLWQGFVTSYAFHMAYDARADQRVVGMRDIEPTGWRTQGAQVLLDAVNGWRVDSSDKDAGVWMTTRLIFDEIGGLNERLHAWGFQQTVFQQAIFERGWPIEQLPEFLFFHQHHGGEFRDYDQAKKELEAYWGSADKLRTFRDVSGYFGKVNDETPRTE